MPRTPAQFQQMRHDAHRAILDAALVVFGVRGYAAATVAEVAQQAGVSKGLIYNYFPSKDDLLVGVIQDQVEAAAASRKANEPDSFLPQSERLERLAENTMRRVREH